MPSMNTVIIAGNLTKDPELRALPSGTYVADFRLAINEKYRTKDGEDRETVCYVDVQVWGRMAETCSEFLRKGSGALVEGRLDYQQWETEGQKRSKLQVRAMRVQFLDRPAAQQSEPAGEKSKKQEDPDDDFPFGDSKDGLPF